MNSIFKYLKDKLHVLLFLFLEFICIVSIVRFNVFHSSIYYSNTRKLSGRMHEINSAVFDYFALYNKNQALYNENLELRKKLKTNYAVETKRIFEVNDTLFKQRYTYNLAQVISNSTNRQNNFITINRGSNSKVVVGSGVFCPEGIVGTVIEVSDNYAVVASLLNTNMFKIVPKIKELNGTMGTLLWKGRDPNYLSLEDINKYEAIKKGFHIVTSPYSKNFPEDIPIGIIETIETRPSETFYRIKVKSAVNFGKIQTVYIVVDLFKDEIDKLEAQMKKKEQAK